MRQYMQTVYCRLAPGQAAAGDLRPAQSGIREILSRRRGARAAGEITASAMFAPITGTATAGAWWEHDDVFAVGCCVLYWGSPLLRAGLPFSVPPRSALRPGRSDPGIRPRSLRTALIRTTWSLKQSSSWPLLEIGGDSPVQPWGSALRSSRTGPSSAPLTPCMAISPASAAGAIRIGQAEQESTIIFSTSDNTDPRSNGRTYTVIAQPQVSIVAVRAGRASALGPYPAMAAVAMARGLDRRARRSGSRGLALAAVGAFDAQPGLDDLYRMVGVGAAGLSAVSQRHQGRCRNVYRDQRRSGLADGRRLPVSRAGGCQSYRTPGRRIRRPVRPALLSADAFDRRSSC